MKLCPYLSFDGQCETAFKFYEECLGAKVQVLMPFAGSPMADECPEEWGPKIMHGELLLGDRVLMGSDAMPGQYEATQGTSLMIGIDDPDEAEKTFKALAEGGKVTMPIEETFWAAKFGALIDRFGIPWMINCDKSDNS